MIYRAPSTRSQIFSLLKMLRVFALALSLLAIPAVNSQTNNGLHFELPANGNLRVENLRGAVIAEVWNENYVSVSAVADSGEPVKSPAVIESSSTLLSVRVARGPTVSAQVNL